MLVVNGRDWCNSPALQLKACKRLFTATNEIGGRIGY
jgi:hypothetical protein